MDRQGGTPSVDHISGHTNRFAGLKFHIALAFKIHMFCKLQLHDVRAEFPPGMFFPARLNPTELGFPALG